MLDWLVVSTPLKNMKVSWEYDIPNMEFQKNKFQTTNQLILIYHQEQTCRVTPCPWQTSHVTAVICMGKPSLTADIVHEKPTVI
jgi:hypothetical protein